MKNSSNQVTSGLLEGASSTAASLEHSVQAGLPSLISREILFGNPERVSPQLSPDGKHIAWIAPDKGNVLQVWVKTVGGNDDKILTADKKRGIRQYFWCKDNRTLVYLQDADGDENWHVYGIDLPSANVRDYTPFQGIQAEPVGIHPDFPDELLIKINLRNREAHDIYRLTLSTGALVLDTENPGDVSGWVVDAQFQVRGAQAILPEGDTEIRIRPSIQAPWKTWLHVPVDELAGIETFTADGHSVILSSSFGSDTARVVEKNIATLEEKVLASSPDADADTVLVDPKTRVVQAVSFAPGRSGWQVLDPSIKADFEGISKLHEGDFSLVNRDVADATWLIAFTSDRGPVSYFAWDRAARRGTFLFVHQPRLEALTLAEMKPISFNARDGLKIPGYLTVPAGVPAKHLPLVLLVHGGPWARDSWGFNPTVQWLANRGYACLQVNYRGSVGFGKKHFSASFKQWGLKMHDDLIDAVSWAVEQGVADPGKVAIFGGSYGGYAALAGVTFTPETFACAIAVVGPSNITTFIQAIPPYWKSARGQLDRMVGNIDDPEEAELVRNASPLFKADRIVRPLLIGQGKNDPRVNRAESEQIVAAIQKNGGNVTYVMYPDEGHGFARPENRMDFNARAEAFLGQYLGGRVEPLHDPAGKVPGSSGEVRQIVRGLDVAF